MIPGLQVVDDFISVEEETDLITFLDSQPWGGKGHPPGPEMRRRTQHYGFEFSYRFRKVAKYLGPLPELIQRVVDRAFHREGRFKDFVESLGNKFQPPDCAIVNEYEVGQGIMPHVDASEPFGPYVMALSLLSPCVMTFESLDDPAVAEDVLLKPRSVILMTEESRYRFRHSISKNEIDYYKGDPVVRGRRVSLTFRQITVDPAES